MFLNTHPKPGRSRLETAEADPTLRQLCHDLTVPASSIKLLAQVATAESDPGPAMRARLRQIADEASRIVDICGYVLDQPRGQGPADLDLLVADVADGLRWRYAGLIDVVAEQATVAVHPVVIVRILTNLMDNACRAAGPGGRVLLTVRGGEDRGTLVVADSGPGFGEGESGKASLGLGIVEAMVRRGGGTIRMGASDLGGTAVTVTFPRETPGPSGKSGPPGPARTREAG